MNSIHNRKRWMKNKFNFVVRCRCRHFFLAKIPYALQIDDCSHLAWRFFLFTSVHFSTLTGIYYVHKIPKKYSSIWVPTRIDGFMVHSTYNWFRLIESSTFKMFVSIPFDFHFPFVSSVFSFFPVILARVLRKSNRIINHNHVYKIEVKKAYKVSEWKQNGILYFDVKCFWFWNQFFGIEISANGQFLAWRTPPNARIGWPMRRLKFESWQTLFDCW